MLEIMRWGDLFAYYILWLLMVYLTDVWKINITNAATIVNLWMGLFKVMPVALAHLADAFFGNFRLLLLSALSSATGLGLIWMSTPPVLAKTYGNCSEYKPECIDSLRKQLFYAGLSLTALGMAGLSVTYGPYTAEQSDNGCDCSYNILRCTCCCLKCTIDLIGVAAILVVAFVKKWDVLFGISTILSLVSVVVLLISVKRCNSVGPQGSGLTALFRVLFAASLKIFAKRPQNVNELHENHNLSAVHLLPHSENLRCLDKAAIVLENPTLSEQVQNRWRLCRVTEVEETKDFIRSIPILMTFVLWGVISSLGATYFLEQAKTMNHKHGRAKIPLVLFLWLYAQLRRVFNVFFIAIFAIIQSYGVGTRYFPRTGIVVAMVFAVLCCIAAAKAESRRLDVVGSHGLIDKPDERVPMNIFSVLPQFILLAACDGIYRIAVGCFAFDQAPGTMLKYYTYFTYAFFGLGFFVSPVLVQVVGEISEKTGGINWFQSTLNQSRLDNYYWVLAVLAAINLIVYVVMARFYPFRESRLEQYSELTLTMDDSSF